jgi:glycine hydroxymethyltransferase
MSLLRDGYFTSGLDGDPELAEALRGEMRRQQDGIELIASENIVSRLVLEAQGSVLTNKTVEGPTLRPLLRRRGIRGRHRSAGD